MTFLFMTGSEYYSSTVVNSANEHAASHAQHIQTRLRGLIKSLELLKLDLDRFRRWISVSTHVYLKGTRVIFTNTERTQCPQF